MEIQASVVPINTQLHLQWQVNFMHHLKRDIKLRNHDLKIALLFQRTCSSSVQKGIIIAVIVIILLPVLNLARADCKYTIKCNQQTSSTLLQLVKQSWILQHHVHIITSLHAKCVPGWSFTLSMSVCLFVCLLVCASALNIVYNYVMYNVDMRLSLVDLMAALQFEYSTGVATMSSLALLRVLHTKDPRSKGSPPICQQ